LCLQFNANTAFAHTQNMVDIALAEPLM